MINKAFRSISHTDPLPKVMIPPNLVSFTFCAKGREAVCGETVVFAPWRDLKSCGDTCSFTVITLN